MSAAGWRLETDHCRSLRQEKVGRLKETASHSHPVSTGWRSDRDRFLTVSTVFDSGRPGKPLKRLRPFLTNPDTRLKPGVNETKTPLV
jgi:hypothetical protein